MKIPNPTFALLVGLGYAAFAASCVALYHMHEHLADIWLQAIGWAL